jgi:A/G-specific adenine glycosylase
VTVGGLRELPGFGEYTAAAVASMAFGVRAVAVDGNVERVLARRLGIAEARGGEGRRRLRRAAETLVSAARPGDSNQALMELGATVCLPRRPRCAACPLRPGCRGAAQGTPESYPAARRRRPARAERRVLALVEQRGRLLLVRRPDSSELLAGTWELPWVEAPRREDRLRLGERFAARFGGSWRLGPPVGRLRHAITFHRLEVEVRRASFEAGGAVGEGMEAGWFSRQESAGLPQSSLLAKALVAAGGD